MGFGVYLGYKLKLMWDAEAAKGSDGRTGNYGSYPFARRLH